MTLVRAASSIAKAQKSTPTASKTTAPSTKTTAPVNNATVGLSAAQVAGLKGLKGIDQNLLSNYKAGTGGTAITASKLVPNAPVNIPTKYPVTGVPDIGAVNQGLTDTAGGITTDATGKFVVTPTTAPTSTDKYSGLTNLFNQYQAQSNAIKPPSGEAIYNAQYKADGIAQKQQAVNDYTAQLNTIVANRDANVLKVEGQGRGIPDVIIGGQQAQINKEAAIAALPVQAQLAAAQGNLELAQSHLDTMFKIKSQDATNQFNYKTKLLDSVYNFASGIEQKKLDDLKVEEDRKYQEQQTFIKAQQAALSNALGQGAPASIYNAIKNATDLNGVTIAAGIYNGDVLAREAQRANIAQSYASIAASKATQKAAEAAAKGALTAEDNARFNSTPETASVRNATKYAEAAQNYKNAMNTYGTGELFGKGKGALGQAYSALVGATKDYYSLGTLDNGVQKLIALGIAEPSIWNLKSTQVGAIDQTLEASKQVIARDLARLNATTYAGSEELKSLASEADKVISTGTVQKTDVDEFNKAWGTNTSTAAFSPSAFF